MFVPIICINQFYNFDEAIKLANKIEYGLTAGIFTENKKELLDKLIDNMIITIKSIHIRIEENNI